MPATEAKSRKITALAKLHQAIHLIDSARESMSMLEGNGYCDIYEKLAATREQVAGLTERLDRLKPPTGVFHI